MDRQARRAGVSGAAACFAALSLAAAVLLGAAGAAPERVPGLFEAPRAADPAAPAADPAPPHPEAPAPPAKGLEPPIPAEPETPFGALSHEAKVLRVLTEDLAKRRVAGETGDVPRLNKGVWICPKDGSPLTLVSTEDPSQTPFIGYFCEKEKRYWAVPLAGREGGVRSFVGPFDLDDREGIESAESLRRSVGTLVAELSDPDTTVQAHATDVLGEVGTELIRALSRLSLDQDAGSVGRDRARILLAIFGKPVEGGGAGADGGARAADPARELYEYAVEYDMKNPSEYDEVAKRYRYVIEKHAGTTWALRARDRIEDLERERQAMIDNDYKHYKELGEDYLRKGNVDMALSTWEAFIVKYRGTPQAEKMYLGVTKIKKEVREAPPRKPGG